MYYIFFLENGNIFTPVTSWQSSTDSEAFPLKAIDGIKGELYNNEGCSCTLQNNTEPWFMLDLGSQYNVVAVELFTMHFHGDALE